MNLKQLRVWVLFIMSITMVACVSNQHLVSDDTFPVEYPGYILTWIEKKAGEPERQIRMLIVENYLRIEHNNNRKSYIVFDNSKKLIYEHSHEGKAPVIRESSIDVLDKKIKPNWIEQTETSHALTRKKTEDNNEVIHYRYSLGSDTCYNVVSVNHYLQDVLPILKAYQKESPVETGSDIVLIEEKNRACYSAINTDDPNKRYEKGFPIREWTSYGYQRFLLDYKIVKLSSSVFQ